MTSTKLLTGLLIGALLSSAALADTQIQVSVINGKQQANFSLGDSKCVLVGDVIKCMPTVMASN